MCDKGRRGGITVGLKRCVNPLNWPSKCTENTVEPMEFGRVETNFRLMGGLQFAESRLRS